MDFEFSSRCRELQERLIAFMESEIYPNEARFHQEVEANRRAGNAWVPTKIVEELKPKARAAGLWNLFLPDAELGAGLSVLEYPDAGNPAGLLKARQELTDLVNLLFNLTPAAAPTAQKGTPDGHRPKSNPKPQDRNRRQRSGTIHPR